MRGQIEGDAQCDVQLVPCRRAKYSPADCDRRIGVDAEMAYTWVRIFQRSQTSRHLGRLVQLCNVKRTMKIFELFAIKIVYEKNKQITYENIVSP